MIDSYINASWLTFQVVIEGLMQLLRSVLLALFVYIWPFQAVLMYGVSQLIGSLLYCFAYYGLFIHTFSKKEEAAKLPIQNIWQMLPRTEGDKMLVSPNFCRSLDREISNNDSKAKVCYTDYRIKRRIWQVQRKEILVSS